MSDNMQQIGNRVTYEAFGLLKCPETFSVPAALALIGIVRKPSLKQKDSFFVISEHSSSLS